MQRRHLWPGPPQPMQPGASSSFRLLPSCIMHVLLLCIHYHHESYCAPSCIVHVLLLCLRNYHASYLNAPMPTSNLRLPIYNNMGWGRGSPQFITRAG